MKKYFVLVLSILLAVALISCTGEAGPTGPAGDKGDSGTPAGEIPNNATILLNENFDSFAVGTTPTTNALEWRRAETWYYAKTLYHHVTNSAQNFASYNQSLMLNTNTLTYDRHIVKAPLLTSIPNTSSGKIYISFKVKKLENNKGKGFVFYINQLEKLRLNLSEVNSYQYHTGINTYAAIDGWGYGIEWITVNITLDLTNDTYDILTEDDRQHIITNIPCYNAQEQTDTAVILNSSQSVYTSFFGILTNTSVLYANDTTYIDDLVIYYLP